MARRSMITYLGTPNARHDAFLCDAFYWIALLCPAISGMWVRAFQRGLVVYHLYTTDEG